MNFISIIFGSFFFIFGLLIALGKVHTHLQMWAQMTENEKSHIKVRPLYQNIGALIGLLGLLLLSNGFISLVQGKIFLISMIVWVILGWADAIFISKSSVYKK